MPAHYHLARCYQRAGRAADKKLVNWMFVLQRDPRLLPRRLLLAQALPAVGGARPRLAKKLTGGVSPCPGAGGEAVTDRPSKVATQPRSADTHWHLACVYQEQSDTLAS